MTASMTRSEGGQSTALVTMRTLLPNLRASERRIAELFLADPEASAELAIAEVAERSGTSTTSVIRLCKRLGYKGFKDLRNDVLREVTRESFETAAFAGTPRDIDRSDSIALGKAADALAAATRIDIFGLGASSFVGEDLQQKLVRIGRAALRWPDSHAAWTAATTLGPGCVAVALSHSGATVDTISFLELARSAGATTIAITNHSSSPLTEAAVVLTTAARETGFRSGALGSRIAQLMVIDCLFIRVAQLDFDASMEAIRNTYATIQRLTAKR